MRGPLILNHSFLDGIAYAAPASAKQPLIDIAAAVAFVQAIRGDGTLRVHHELGQSDVGGKSFVSWASQQRRSPEWRDILEHLLRLLSGPFVCDLPVSDEAPTNVTPTCSSSPNWLRQMVFHAGHHGLSLKYDSFFLSFGNRPSLKEEAYSFQRSTESSTVHNYRSLSEAKSRIESIRSEHRAALTPRQVLEEAARQMPLIRVLPSAWRSVDDWDGPVPGNFFAAVVGLGEYSAALERNETRASAVRSYTLKAGVEMSQEKAATLDVTHLRKQREFTLPDGVTELFDVHAKPGAIRIHVFARREAIEGTKTDMKYVVYIGHCGRHLDLR